MRLAVIMPVVLQNESLLATTLCAVEHLRSEHAISLYVVCNRLSVCSPEDLHRKLAERFAGRVEVMHEPGVERSVAGAWNAGCRRALQHGADYIAFVANDTRVDSDCLDRLVEHGERSQAELWSGISHNNRGDIDRAAITDGADFSCFMIRPKTIDRFGWFDANYRPAYFEDNDYYARVVLGGGECHVVHGASFFHHGSMTIRADAEMAHHVRYWFDANRRYFASKWGVTAPENSKEGVRQRYYPYPFNDPSNALSWFPGEAY